MRFQSCIGSPSKNEHILEVRDAFQQDSPPFHRLIVSWGIDNVQLETDVLCVLHHIQCESKFSMTCCVVRKADFCFRNTKYVMISLVCCMFSPWYSQCAFTRNVAYNFLLTFATFLMISAGMAKLLMQAYTKAGKCARQMSWRFVNKIKGERGNAWGSPCQNWLKYPILG